MIQRYMVGIFYVICGGGKNTMFVNCFGVFFFLIKIVKERRIILSEFMVLRREIKSKDNFVYIFGNLIINLVFGLYQRKIVLVKY